MLEIQSALPGILKTAREEKGLSTRELAERAGIDQSMVTKIETGKKRPGNETLAKIADELGIRLADKIGGEAPSLTDPDTIRVPLADLAHDLANPRSRRDSEVVNDLAHSIEQKGVLIPLLVRPPQDQSTRYTVFDGGTRLAALHVLRDNGVVGNDYLVPVKIRAIETAEAVLEALVVGKREGLNPMDECEAFARISDAGVATADVAAALGITPRTVQLRLQVARQLSPKGKNLLREELITLAIAEALVGAETPKDQSEAIEAIERGTLKTESNVREYLAGLKSARLAERERAEAARFKNSRPADSMARRKDDDDLDVPPILRAKPRQLDLVETVAEVGGHAGHGVAPPGEASKETPEARWKRQWRGNLGGIDDLLIPPGDYDGPPVSLVLTHIETGKSYRFVFDGMIDLHTGAHASSPQEMKNG